MPIKVHTATIVGFFWDHPEAAKPRYEHNVFHMLDRHGVTTDEVEHVLEGVPVLLDAQVSDVRNPVFGVVGITADGRMLEVWGIIFHRRRTKVCGAQ